MNERKAFERTDRAITQALIRLLKTKEFEKITIQDILNETPVSKGTFYAHFHDKYEIAERMQEEYFVIEQQVLEEIKTVHTLDLGEYTKRMHERHRELVHALLNIHTDRVDLLKHIEEEMCQMYLRRFADDSKTPEMLQTEAKIYGRVMALLHQEYMEGNIPANDNDFTRKAVKNVLSHISVRISL